MKNYQQVVGELSRVFVGRQSYWTRVFALVLAAGLSVSALGCDEGADSGGEESAEEEDKQGDKDEQAEGDKEGSAGGPAEFYSDKNHDFEIPEEGHAWIEVDDARIEFEDINCRLIEGDENTKITSGASVKSDTYGPVEIMVRREVGNGEFTPYEAEDVQLTLVGGWEDREFNSIALMQHTRNEKDGFKWLKGSGEVPAVRVTKEQVVTAQGTLSKAPFADADEVKEGDFKLAINCEPEG